MGKEEERGQRKFISIRNPGSATGGGAAN